MRARRTGGIVAVALVAVLMTAGCGVDPDALAADTPFDATTTTTTTTTAPGGTTTTTSPEDLVHPEVGEHWHMAFGTEVCGEFLPPPADAGSDVLGIHTHEDGVIHIHPFDDSVAGEHATLGAFLDQVGGSIDTDEVVVSDERIRVAGRKCDGEPVVIRVAVWDSADDAAEGSAPTRIISDHLSDIHLGPDLGAMVISVEAVPTGFLPPPVAGDLRELVTSDSGPPASTLPSVAGKPCVAEGEHPIGKGEPAVPVPIGTPPRKLVTLDLAKGIGPATKVGDEVELNLVGVACSSGEVFESTWLDGDTVPVTVGVGDLLVGLDLALIGMQAGGRRLVVLPPELAFGDDGQDDIAPGETLIWIIEVVSIS